MKFLMRLNARITAHSGILKKPEGDVRPEDVTRQDDPAGPRCDQEFDGSLDSFVLITFNYNFSFAGFSQTRRWARNIQPRRWIDGGYEPLPCILSKHLLYVHDEVDFCCIVAGYRQLQRGVAILVLHIEVCIRAVEKKFENSRLLQFTRSFRTPSGNFGCLLHSTWRHRWTSQESSPPSDSYGVVERIELLPCPELQVPRLAVVSVVTIACLAWSCRIPSSLWLPSIYRHVP